MRRQGLSDYLSPWLFESLLRDMEIIAGRSRGRMGSHVRTVLSLSLETLSQACSPCERKR